MERKQKEKSITDLFINSARNSILIFLFFIFATSIFVLYANLSSVIKKTAQIQAKSAADQISQIIKSYKNIALMLGSDPILFSENASEEENQDNLWRVCSLYGIRKCDIINLDGFSGTTYLGDRQYFEKAAGGKVYVSDVLVSRYDGIPTVAVSAPIFSKTNPNEVSAVIVCSINTADFDDVAKKFLPTKNSKSFVIGRTGVGVSYAGGNFAKLIGKKIEVLREKIREQENGDYDYLNGISRLFFYFCKIEEIPGWKFCICIPMSDFFYGYFTGLCILFFISIVAMFFINRRIKIVSENATASVKNLANTLQQAVSGEVVFFNQSNEMNSVESRQISEATGKLMDRLDADINAIEEVKVNMNLGDLVDVKIVQEIQDLFSSIFSMSAVTTDVVGVPITQQSNFTDFCKKYIRGSELGLKNCELCDRGGALNSLERGKVVPYTCHAGLVDFSAPILLHGHFIGSFVGGQVRTCELKDDHLRELAMAYGIPAKDLIESAQGIPLMSEQQLAKASECLDALVGTISRIVEKNYSANVLTKKIALNARHNMLTLVNMNIRLAECLRHWLPNVRVILGSRRSKAIRADLQLLLTVGSEVLSIVDENIEYAKMTDLNNSLKEIEYSPKELVTGIVNVLYDRMKEGVELKARVNASVPKKLLGDVSRISQIINRLLLNSMEFVEQGEIVLELSCRKKLYSVLLEICVSDTGVGMTPSQLEEVRECLEKKKYSQNSESQKSQELKLVAISRLVDQMSGTIAVKSLRGEGSEFIILIPQLEIQEQNDAEV